MGKRVFKPNVIQMRTEKYETDTTTTANTTYTRYGKTTKQQYIERESTVSPFAKEWSWGTWANRASLTVWVPINENYYDF